MPFSLGPKPHSGPIPSSKVLPSISFMATPIVVPSLLASWHFARTHFVESDFQRNQSPRLKKFLNDFLGDDLKRQTRQKLERPVFEDSEACSSCDWHGSPKQVTTLVGVPTIAMRWAVLGWLLLGCLWIWRQTSKEKVCKGKLGKDQNIPWTASGAFIRRETQTSRTTRKRETIDR